MPTLLLGDHRRSASCSASYMLHRTAGDSTSSLPSLPPTPTPQQQKKKQPVHLHGARIHSLQSSTVTHVFTHVDTTTATMPTVPLSLSPPSISSLPSSLSSHVLDSFWIVLRLMSLTYIWTVSGRRLMVSLAALPIFSSVSFLFLLLLSSLVSSPPTSSNGTSLSHSRRRISSLFPRTNIITLASATSTDGANSTGDDGSSSSSSRRDPRCPASFDRSQCPSYAFKHGLMDFTRRIDSSSCTVLGECPQCLVGPEWAARLTSLGLGSSKDVDRRLAPWVLSLNWLSHEYVTTIAMILLKEAMGYAKARAAPSANQGNVDFICCGEEEVMIDMERWGNGEFLSEEGYFSVATVPIGYTGTSSLLVPSYTLDKYPMANAYNAYKYLPEYGHIFPKAFSTNCSDMLVDKSPANVAASCGTSSPSSSSNKNSNKYVCDDNPWTDTVCVDGHYVPPQCQDGSGGNNNPIDYHNRSQYCQELFMTDPYYDTAIFEAIVKNNKLNFTAAYIGAADYPTFIKEKYARREDFIFYWYSPDPLTAAVGGRAITFDPVTPDCLKGRTADPTTSTAGCAYPVTTLQKYARRDVLKKDADFKFFFDSFSIDEGTINLLLAGHTSGAGNQSVYEGSCSWLKQNYATWGPWIRHTPTLNGGGSGGSLNNASTEFQMWIIAIPAAVIVLLIAVGIATFCVRRRLRNLHAPKTGPLAILFTDVESSTTLWELCGSDMKAAMKAHNLIIRKLIADYNAYEVKTNGDSFMIACRSLTDATLLAMAIQTSLNECTDIPQSITDTYEHLHTNDVSRNPPPPLRPAAVANNDSSRYQQKQQPAASAIAAAGRGGGVVVVDKHGGGGDFSDVDAVCCFDAGGIGSGGGAAGGLRGGGGGVLSLGSNSHNHAGGAPNSNLDLALSHNFGVVGAGRGDPPAMAPTSNEHKYISVGDLHNHNITNNTDITGDDAVHHHATNDVTSLNATTVVSVVGGGPFLLCSPTKSASNNNIHNNTSTINTQPEASSSALLFLSPQHSAHHHFKGVGDNGDVDGGGDQREVIVPNSRYSVAAAAEKDFDSRPASVVYDNAVFDMRAALQSNLPENTNHQPRDAPSLLNTSYIHQQHHHDNYDDNGDGNYLLSPSSDNNGNNNNNSSSNNLRLRPWNGLRVRIGLHWCSEVTPTLDPITGRYDYFGHDVNVTARVEGYALGGQVLIQEDTFLHLTRSEEFADLVSPDVILTHVAKAAELKGVQGRVGLWSMCPTMLMGRVFRPLSGVELPPVAAELHHEEDDGGNTFDNSGWGVGDDASQHAISGGKGGGGAAGGVNSSSYNNNINISAGSHPTAAAAVGGGGGGGGGDHGLFLLSSSRYGSMHSQLSRRSLPSTAARMGISGRSNNTAPTCISNMNRSGVHQHHQFNNLPQHSGAGGAGPTGPMGSRTASYASSSVHQSSNCNAAVLLNNSRPTHHWTAATGGFGGEGVNDAVSQAVRFAIATAAQCLPTDADRHKWLATMGEKHGVPRASLAAVVAEGRNIGRLTKIVQAAVVNQYLSMLASVRSANGLNLRNDRLREPRGGQQSNQQQPQQRSPDGHAGGGGGSAVFVSGGTNDSFVSHRSTVDHAAGIVRVPK